MGKILLFLLGIFAVIMLISFVISALHFLFYVALIAVIVVAAMRITGGMRRRRVRSVSASTASPLVQPFTYDALPGRVVFGPGTARARLADEVSRWARPACC